jgi:peptidoglycan/LPS O-acetylase OafA/YrhL
MMAALGHLTYKFVEAPFLRLRRPYLRSASASNGGSRIRLALERALRRAETQLPSATRDTRPIAAED